MLETELSAAVKEVKSPAWRIIVIAAAIIIGTLASVSAFLWHDSSSVKKESYIAIFQENAELKNQNRSQAQKIDSLINLQYQYVLKQLEYERSIRETKVFIDSVNTEVMKLKKIMR